MYVCYIYNEDHVNKRDNILLFLHTGVERIILQKKVHNFVKKIFKS